VAGNLAEYRRKRRPDATPEPFGAAARDGDAPVFVVQRHSARRLHYDFRLERDGALASWAVPKGIPMAPGTRRLAVHVEDHPLDYAGFEGEIPAGQYGAGTVEIWDSGTYETVSEKSDGGLTVRLRGRRLRGTWALAPAGLDGDPKNWLIIRKREPDPHAWPDERYPPMLARLGDAPPPGDAWAHEIKWDGYRTMARLRAGEPSLWSRNDQDLTERFAAVARRLERAIRTSECVLDGEVCALDPQGRPRFGLLQRSEGTLVYAVFDLLELEGEPVLERPWAERRELLEPLVVADDPVVRFSAAFPDGPALLTAARAQGLEGIVSKRRDSLYRPGQRTPDWVKSKVRQEQEFVVAGYRPGQGSRARFGALVVAVNGPRGLVWAGNVGTGFTQAEIDRLLDLLGPLRRDDAPLAEVPAELRKRAAPVVWVEPELVCQVQFVEWTDDGRLRAPVYLGLRDDKTAAEVVREAPGGDAPSPEAEPTAPPEPAPAPPDVGRVKLTNQHKVFFPDEGITKGDLIAYYRAVAPVLVPHLRDRPFTMIRYPDGIAGGHFFQKDRPKHLPDWIPVSAQPASSGEDARVIRYPLVNEADAVAWMVNAGCIDMNAWYSRADRPLVPDYVLFDLDPSEGSGFAEAAQVALLVREALELIGLHSYPKTSSARGLHVMVPIDPIHDYAEARELCVIVARALEGTHRGLVTTEWAKARRRGVLIDSNQIGFGRTISSAYSVRPRPGAPVSTPLDWEEVHPDLDPRGFDMRTVLDRVERRGDLFAPVLEGGQQLGPALARLR
jgi:bifunctional non-homologous end joining protein LigD